MSRGKHTSVVRCFAVWLLVTTGVLVTWAVVAAPVRSLGTSTTWHTSFEDLLVAVASMALTGSAGWLWVVTTVTVVDVVRGRVPTQVPRGVTRRLVLAACGAAVVAGISSPALAGAGVGVGAGPGASEPSLVGLPLPDRAVVHATANPANAERHAEQHPAPAIEPRVAVRPSHSDRAVTVAAGDSLWSIAAAALGPDADVSEIDAAWRALYAANRDAIGSDPDLIRPGLDLEPQRKARP